MGAGYRHAVRLYPRAFRDEFGDDLVDLFHDLAVDRGPVAAWRICGMDLLVTIPRLHLERIMNERTTTTTLNAALVLLTAGGVISYFAGIPVGLVLIAAAAVLGISQRSALARAVRVPEEGLRRRRLTTAAVLAAAFVASYLVFLATIGDSWDALATVLAVFGTICMVASVVYLVVGLLTPRPSRSIA